MIKVGVVGGTGYTGVELLRLLASHPQVELAAITSRAEAGTPVAKMFPSLRGRVDISFSDPASAPLTPDLASAIRCWWSMKSLSMSGSSASCTAVA